MLKLKYAIAKIISLPSVGNFIAMLFKNRIPYNSIIVKVNSPLITGRIKAYLFWGLYESSEARLIKKYLINNALPIIELGASIGVVSSLINKYKKAGVLSYHFEADERFIPIVEENLKLNKSLNYLVEQSIIGKKGYEFKIGENNTVGKVIQGNNSNQGCVPLNEVLEKHKINEYFLVSDIEGAEAFFLIDEPKPLDKCMGILIELHKIDINNKTYNIHDLKSAISNLGFNIVEENGPNIFAIK